MLTGFTLPKLLWVRDHEPENFARVKKVLLPKDYVRFELTGEYASDVSDASGTGLFDVVNRRWAFELADRVGVARDYLAVGIRIERVHRQDSCARRGGHGTQSRNAGDWREAAIRRRAP